MKIDWSKAPKGAEEAGVGPCGDARWYRGVNGQEYSVWSSTTSKWNGFNGKPSIKTREKRPVGPNNGIDWSLAPEGAEEAGVGAIIEDVCWYKDITCNSYAIWLTETLEWLGFDGTPSLKDREKRPVEDVSEIDWSKAPEGAEEAGVSGGGVLWYKDVTVGGYKLWAEDGMWLRQSGTPGCKAREKRPVEPAASKGDAVSKARKAGERDPENNYMREILPGVWIDVYHLLDAFKTESSAVDHAVKKCLAPGQRGVKDRIQDLEEARDSLNRAIEDAKMWEAAK